MKSRIIMILLVLSSASSLLSGDHDTKMLEYSSDQRIKSLNCTENYFGVRLFDNGPKATIAIAYDRNGNELFRKGGNSKSHIIFASPNERLNSFIVIFEGTEATSTKAEEADTIAAFDLRTGELLWQSHCVAGQYAISPDSRYLLSQEPAEPDRGMILEIIDLRDGSIIKPQFNLQDLHATWYDSLRIIIVTQEYERNVNRKKNPFEIISEKRSKLLNEKLYILSSLARPQLSLDDKNKHLKRLEEINREIEYLENEAKRLRDTLPAGREGRKILFPSSSWVAKSLRILLYNWKSEQVEQERIVEGINVGEKQVPIIYERQSAGGGSGIIVDNTGHFYLMGHYYNQKPERAIIKLDKTLNVIWKYVFAYDRAITNFLIFGQPYFRIANRADGSYEFLNPQSGKVLSPDALTDISKQLREFDFSCYPFYMAEVRTQDIAVQKDEKVLVKTH